MAESGFRIEEADLQRFLRKAERAALSEKPAQDALNLLEARAVELAPVQTGNLEGSWAQQVRRAGGRVLAAFGFGAPYAADVHELPPHARGPRTRRKPAGKYGEAGPKFLERAMRGVTSDGSLARTIAEAYARLFRG